MSAEHQLTPFDDVNDILGQILAGVHLILKDQFVGMMLYGSLALGDFDPQRSDIDIIVITAGELSEPKIISLLQMHERITSGASRWAVDIECSYIPQAALRRYDPDSLIDFPRLERGQDRQLAVVKHDTDWILNYYVLREHGVVVAGPEPKSLIDPIRPDQLRRAVLDQLWWWESILTSSGIESSGYQAYAILTMCRILYTLHFGAIASKPVAARWAKETLGLRWAPLIEFALTWQADQPFDHLADTLDFIRYTLARCRQPASDG